MDHSLEEFRFLENPFARVLEVGRLALEKDKLNEEYLYQLQIGLVRRLKENDYGDYKIRQIMNFLRTYLRFEDQEIIRKFESEVDHIFENSKAMGIEEIILEETRKQGKIEGKIEEKVQTAYKSWKAGLSTELTAELTALSLEKIETLFAEFASKSS